MTTCSAPRATTTRAAVAIVVLNWNGREDSLALMRSLWPQLGEDDRVILVDNGSTDGSVPILTAEFPELVVLQNRRNRGFAGGNNVGLRHALLLGTPWVMVLNNDTLLPVGSFDALLAGAEELRARTPRLGALQPVLVRADDERRIDSCGQLLGRLPWASDLAVGRSPDELPREPIPIFGTCGAATLLRREALAAVGGFDDELFVLFEDTDLAFRLRAAGWTAALLPGTRIAHRRGVSNRRSGEGARRRKVWVQRNLVALALRWWPAAALATAVPLLLLRAAHALLLAKGGRRACLRLWSRAVAERASCRRGLRRYDVDVWFGRDPLRTG